VSKQADRQEAPGSKLVDARIKEIGGWRGARLAGLRGLIMGAVPSAVEEMKWKKPSNPSGVPVWSQEGIVCIGEALKSAVRLTFPKGAQIRDPKKIFNARLDSNSVRAVDFHESDIVDEAALKAIVLGAVRLNASKTPKA
jgi:hypothetical protein